MGKRGRGKLLLCRKTFGMCSFMPGEDLDMEGFEQAEVMPRSTLAICSLQDRLSFQGTGKQCHIQPFASGYQLVTRAAGRSRARI